jgi:hypothetical protein
MALYRPSNDSAAERTEMEHEIRQKILAEVVVADKTMSTRKLIMYIRVVALAIAFGCGFGLGGAASSDKALQSSGTSCTARPSTFRPT